jgi:hypothetical protein
MNSSTIRRALSPRSLSHGFALDDELILIRHLERRLDLLTVLCQAQWELLQEKTGLTEEDLAAKIDEVDRRDGAADGRMGTAISGCTSCGRPGNARRAVCLYCGAELPRSESFAV